MDGDKCYKKYINLKIFRKGWGGGEREREKGFFVCVHTEHRARHYSEPLSHILSTSVGGSRT